MSALDQFCNIRYNETDCAKVYAEAHWTLPQRSTCTLVKHRDLIRILYGWEDTEWCFQGNQNIIPEIQYMAILDFYQVHKNSSTQDAYFMKLPNIYDCFIPQPEQEPRINCEMSRGVQEVSTK
ncbi:hypothetical protein B0H14DRAFT_2575864 [Mycena olivaceomarginata]|nr:hypothetical protein B0H14DRAFT_2575864 [Mycena olivaceomarginata]